MNHPQFPFRGSKAQRLLKKIREQNIHDEDVEIKQLLEWQSPDQSLKGNRCETCELLYAQAIVKEKYCCSTRGCRLDHGKTKLSHQTKEERRKVIGQLLEKVTGTITVSANEKRRITQKRKYNSFSDEERKRRKRSREVGLQRMLNDKTRKERWKMNIARGKRWTIGVTKIHQHYVKTGKGQPLIVWTKGWEHRTIKLLEEIFGDDDIYVNYGLRNDIGVVREENDIGEDLQGLKTRTIYCSQDSELRHELDHELVVKHGCKDDFINKLCNGFGCSVESFTKFWPEGDDGDVHVAIETKSFRRAVNQAENKVDWFERIRDNAMQTLDSAPNMIYLLFNWTEASCSFFVMTDNNNSTTPINHLGTILYNVLNQSQAEKHHHQGYEKEIQIIVPCPNITKFFESSVPKPLRSAKLDSKDGIFITTTTQDLPC